jgi:C-terminal processing protease CtpA/Prc
MSSGEAFVLMMHALPHAVTIGGTTRGASGNPAKFELPGLNVNVWYSRWVALLPDGNVFEGTGVTPDVEITPPFSAFQGDADPIWEKGIELLRQKVQ